MLLQLFRRCLEAERLALADAEALMRAHGRQAYTEARRRERDTVLPDGTAYISQRAHWRRVALIVARMTGKRVGLDTASRIIEPRLATGRLTVQYQIQFLGNAGNVIRELSASAHNVADAIKLISDADWPPLSVTLRVLDHYGRAIHSA